MSQPVNVSPDQRRRRYVAAGLCLIAWPVVLVVADLIRMTADTNDGDETLGVLQAIAANLGAFELAGWLFYLFAALTIPVTILLWRLAVDRSPKLAWTGAVLGTMSVVGQFVHLNAYFGQMQALAQQSDLSVAAEMVDAQATGGFAAALFAPYLIGLILAPLFQSIALFRAKVLPLWAMISVIVGQVVFAVLQSNPVGTSAYGALLLVGFLPAALLAIRGTAATSRAGVQSVEGVTIPVS
jgi:hypothetical protein